MLSAQYSLTLLRHAGASFWILNKSAMIRLPLHSIKINTTIRLLLDKSVPLKNKLDNQKHLVIISFNPGCQNYTSGKLASSESWEKRGKNASTAKPAITAVRAVTAGRGVRYKCWSQRTALATHLRQWELWSSWCCMRTHGSEPLLGLKNKEHKDQDALHWCLQTEVGEEAENEWGIQAAIVARCKGGTPGVNGHPNLFTGSGLCVVQE